MEVRAGEAEPASAGALAHHDVLSLAALDVGANVVAAVRPSGGQGLRRQRAQDGVTPAACEAW
jgi:hypothetical protein